MYQSMRNVMGRVLRLLDARLEALPEAVRTPATALFEKRNAMAGIFESFLRRRVQTRRIRCHGNLDLGRFLYTGKDFVIIDLEGDNARPAIERLRKRSALRDVATMACSFHDTALSVLLDLLETGALGERDYASLEPFANLFSTWSSWAFVRGYLETAGGGVFAPADQAEVRALFDAFRLEKALRQLEVDLTQDLGRVRIALHGIEQIVRRAGS
jgi:maltose alpha-D-glucosyltransferase / alpha-amylase